MRRGRHQSRVNGRWDTRVRVEPSAVKTDLHFCAHRVVANGREIAGDDGHHDHSEIVGLNTRAREATTWGAVAIRAGLPIAWLADRART